MAEQALGRITTNAGVPARLTANEPDPARPKLCHSYLVEALPTNTGRVYILASALGSGALMNDVIAWLAAPTATSSPSYSATISSAPNGLDVSQRWLDVQNNGDGVIVSILIC